MTPDRLTVALRPRPTWETFDLGLRLVRANAGAVYGAFAAVALPIGVAVALVSLGHPVWIPLLALWWSKPILDRVVLHVIARAAFGEVPGVRATLRAAPALARSGLLGGLLLGRLGTDRGFVLPITQLEGGRRTQRLARRRLLARSARRSQYYLTETCLLIELAIFASIVLLLELWLPGSLTRDIWTQVGAPTPPDWIVVAACASYLVAMAAMEPFYVGAAFALYLRHRILLEGWDLEIAMRRMVAAHPVEPGRRAA